MGLIELLTLLNTEITKIIALKYVNFIIAYKCL